MEYPKRKLNCPEYKRDREKKESSCGCAMCVCLRKVWKMQNLKYLPRRCSQCNSKGTGLLLVDSCFEHDQATKTEEPGFTHSVIFLNIKRQNIQTEHFIK